MTNFEIKTLREISRSRPQ